MTSPRGTRAVPRWARAGLIAGLATSVHVPVGIVAIELIPVIWLAYPLLLLPLLLTGPLAVGRLKLKQAMLALALAGMVSGVVAAGSFAVAWKLLGDWFWMLTSAAGAPPMPPLSRIMMLPGDWFTWAHQDVLFFQPLLAFGALTVLTLLVGMVGFGMIEEMHIRSRHVQLRADWQRQLGTIRATLDEELTAVSTVGHQATQVA